MPFIHIPKGPLLTIALACSLSLLLSLHRASAQEKKTKPISLEDFVEIPKRETFPTGIVYGPKAAFKIGAPKGWVVDNQAGQSQGLPCVLYPEGSTWADAEVVMYAKIASVDTTDRDAFIKAALAHMSEGNEHFKHERIAEGKTSDGHAWVINDYRHGAREDAANSQFERVAYVQLPGAVAFVVFTVPNEELHKKHAAAVQEVMKAFTYTPEFINFGKKKDAPAKKGKK